MSVRAMSHVCSTCGWECNGSCPECDGISLCSTAHPQPPAPWWKRATQRIWWCLFPIRLNEDSLEMIEIDLPTHEELQLRPKLGPLEGGLIFDYPGYVEAQRRRREAAIRDIDI